MAGDPCQLAPLVSSPQEVGPGRAGLGRSLFERLLAAGHPATLLPRQYRCHPQVRTRAGQWTGACRGPSGLEGGRQAAVMGAEWDPPWLAPVSLIASRMHAGAGAEECGSCASVHPSLCLSLCCASLQLSAVPNAHFYGGRLVDGCSAAQRPALLPGCPPLAMLDVRCSSRLWLRRLRQTDPAEVVAHGSKFLVTACFD